jgi:hypothetical protein
MNFRSSSDKRSCNTSLKNDLEAAGKALVQARADKKAQELHWR